MLCAKSTTAWWCESKWHYLSPAKFLRNNEAKKKYVTAVVNARLEATWQLFAQPWLRMFDFCVLFSIACLT